MEGRLCSAVMTVALQSMSDGPATDVPVQDERIRGLLRYWMEIRGGRGAPERRDFDPTRVAPVLKFFWILESRPSDGAWHFTLAGEETLRLMGRELIGKSIEDVYPKLAAEYNGLLAAVIETPAVLHMAGDLYRSDQGHLFVERLAVPMRDGDRVDRVYGVSIQRWPTATRRGPIQFQGSNVKTLVVPSRDL